MKHNQHRTGSMPNKMLAKKLPVLALVLAAAIVPACAKDIAVVANKSGTVTALTMADLVKICKAQTNRWSDGTPVTLIVRDPASPEMTMVEEKIYGMTPNEIRDLIATANHGRTNRPAILVADSDQEVIRRVQSAPGAVGLVDVYSITGAVKVVKIGGKLPLEPGYPLHGN
jgi:ABC-type phosphate transport system substrate-binding protein